MSNLNQNFVLTLLQRYFKELVVAFVGYWFQFMKCGPIARIRAHSLVHEVRNTALAIWSPDVVPLSRPLASAR